MSTNPPLVPPVPFAFRCSAPEPFVVGLLFNVIALHCWSLRDAMRDAGATEEEVFSEPAIEVLATTVVDTVTERFPLGTAIADMRAMRDGLIAATIAMLREPPAPPPRLRLVP